MDDLHRRIDAVALPPHPLLVELEERSRADGMPLVSRETGRFLSTVVTAMQASRILEVGTGYGYATLWMALAQPRMGRIWTIEPDVARTDVAQSYFRRAEEDDYIETFNTPVHEMLENFPHRNLDVVFVTAGQSEYRDYLELLIPMLKLSGLAIFEDCVGRPGVRPAFSLASRARRDHPSARRGNGHRRAPQMTSEAAFRNAMRHVATGVTVVTSLRDGEPRGITVNAFASVSLEPPSLLICINREARSYLFISTSRVFCVNVLAGEQRALAEHFSGKVRDRQFDDVAYRIDTTGAPVLEGTIAHFDCELARRVSVRVALHFHRARSLVRALAPDRRWDTSTAAFTISAFT